MSFPQPSTAAATTGTATSTFIQLRTAHLDSTPKCAVSEFFGLYRQLRAPFQALLDEVFARPGAWSAFAVGPSSKCGHHCGPGGNLRHSVDVARLSLLLAADPVAEHLVDRDVLIVAALLHDLGKALEYKSSVYGTKMSPLGRLVGHKFTGFGMLWTPLHSVPGIGEHQRLALLNCLSCSHQGAFGGARGPACLEAQIVHHADQFSASSNLFSASLAASRSDAGFGVRHKHQRETPYHVKPRAQVVSHAQLDAQGAPRLSVHQRMRNAVANASHPY